MSVSDAAVSATRRYRYACTVCLGADEGSEFEVEVSYTVAWGSPETGRGYLADPALYDPGSPDVIEDIRVETIESKPRPWDYGCGFISDDEMAQRIIEKLEDHEDAMLRVACEWAAYDADRARKSRHEN